jgi:Ankyrin repeat
VKTTLDISNLLIQSFEEYKYWVDDNYILLVESENSDVILTILRSLIYDLDNCSNDAIIEQKIEYLSFKGINIAVYNTEFYPLLAAIGEQNFAIVSLLLNAGASVDIRNNEGTTPLTEVVILNNIDLLTILLKFSNKETVNKFGSFWVKTPIGIAFLEMNIVMISLLLQYGADPYIKDWDKLNGPMIDNIPNDCPAEIRDEITVLIKEFYKQQ